MQGVSLALVELFTAQYLLLFVSSFLATLIGSMLGIGGGFIVLGVLSVLLPVTVLVPVLAGVLACIDLSRAVAFRAHIHTPTCSPFLLGCVLGVAGGATLFLSLPEAVIGTGLALLILFSLALPSIKLRWRIRYPFFWVGAAHSFLSTLFGYGGLFQAAMLQTALTNLQITATLAAGFLVLELMKIGSYLMGGFDYQPYLGLIVAAACGAIPASLLGRRLAQRVSSELYKSAQRAILALIAINILLRVWI
ncbi:MAG: sulfite exporter TauE/SafE family protein [Gammaproteobacteria bacterium]|nr:sulfite exporter TauE/SafE family protein [Gammaproteobacteria bacterium]